MMISENYRCRSLFDGFLCIFNLKKVTIRWKNSNSSVVSGTHVFAVWRQIRFTKTLRRHRRLVQDSISVRFSPLNMLLKASDHYCYSKIYWIYLNNLKKNNHYNKTCLLETKNEYVPGTGYCNIIFLINCVPCIFEFKNMTKGMIFFYPFFLTILM